MNQWEADQVPLPIIYGLSGEAGKGTDGGRDAMKCGMSLCGKGRLIFWTLLSYDDDDIK